MPLNETARRAKAFIVGRKGAYGRVFNPVNRDAELVLRDLAKFCRAHETTFNPDPRMHAVLEGRREVWLRIAQHMNLTDDQLWLLHGGPLAKGD